MISANRPSEVPLSWKLSPFVSCRRSFRPIFRLPRTRNPMFLERRVYKSSGAGGLLLLTIEFPRPRPIGA